MPAEIETLTTLVADRVGPGKEMSYRVFEERAVDPVSGYKPSRHVLWKIVNGKNIELNPNLVAALAAGLSMPLERVQAAAAYQYTGLVFTAVAGGTVVHEPGTDTSDLPLASAVFERWEAEEDAPSEGNHSA